MENPDIHEDDFLDRRLGERRDQDSLRSLRLPDRKTDFCSNDYLGIATRGLLRPSDLGHGSMGSRLLAGNYPLIEEAERQLASFHAAPAAMLFNSGYDANLGVLSCVPQRGDIILYDQLSHASIRDGIRLSFAQSFPFLHNDCGDLERRLKSASGTGRRIFVATESVFSMDGDLAPLENIVGLCRSFSAHLILDEAHATGVIGEQGEGLAQQLGLHGACLARVHTFGKAVGCHGAIVLGSVTLRQYLINFCRPLIYSTALPPVAVRAIADAYRLFPGMTVERERLRALVGQFHAAPVAYRRLESSTPIQVVMVPGNTAARALATRLQAAGLDVRPILYPSVPRGTERLRIVIHAFNTAEEVDRLTTTLIAGA